MFGLAKLTCLCLSREPLQQEFVDYTGEVIELQTLQIPCTPEFNMMS